MARSSTPPKVVPLPRRPAGLWRRIHAIAAGLGRRSQPSPYQRRPNPFTPAQPLPGVVGDGRPKIPQIAMDHAEVWKKIAMDDLGGTETVAGWVGAGAGVYASSAYAEGQEWLGYAVLALLSQRPEYRIMVETVATEMTREWITFKSKSTDKGQHIRERIEKIEARLRELKFQKVMKSANINDGFQGRGQVYIDTGEPDNREELKLPLSDLKAVRGKYGRGKFITRLGAIEPMWCYPAAYEASDPLKANWYKPDLWWVMGKEVSRDRLLTFVGAEVPDIIKPAYSFGGIATTQMAKPYVDFWLRNRTSESDLLNNFSLRVLATELDVTTADDGDEIIQRMLTLNTLADNQGILLINKASEEFDIRQTSLGGVSEITKQSMERMTIPSRMPIVKFFGNQPSGLNADSEGVIRMWYDDIKAAQEDRNRDTIQRIVNLVQIELFDEIIDDLTWEFNDLWQLDEAGKQAIQLTKAQIVETDISSGVIDPEEGRMARAKDEDSPYVDLDLQEREAPGEELEEGQIEGGEGGKGPINPKPQTETSSRLARGVESQAAGFGGAASGGFAAHDGAPRATEWSDVLDGNDAEDAGFREDLHPRGQAGSKQGGRFVKKGESESYVGGRGGTEELNLMTTATQHLHDAVHQLAGFGDPSSKLVEHHGQTFDAVEPLPEGMKKGKLKQCFMNATHLMLEDPDRYVYCEGYAQLKDVPGLAIQHAWCLDADTGKVIDPTWGVDPRISAYYGIPLDPQYVQKTALKTGVYGVLSRTNPTMRDQDPSEYVWQPSAENLLSRYNKPTTLDEVLDKFPSDVRAKIKKVQEDSKSIVPTNSPVSEGGYKLPDGRYTTERQRLHAEIIKKILTPEVIASCTPPPGQAPVYTLIGGRPGAGKSFFTQPGGSVDRSTNLYLSGDDIKEMLPEYKGWNSQEVHEEANDIYAKITELAREHKLNVVHDGTMKTLANVKAWIRGFEDAGYQVDGYYMFTPPQVAAERAVSRFLTAGRYMPPELVLTQLTNEKSFDSVKSQFRRWAVYSNMERGVKPKKEASGDNESDKEQHF